MSDPEPLARDFLASAARIGLAVDLAEGMVRAGGVPCHLRAVPAFRFDRLLQSDPVLDKWLRGIPTGDWLAWRLPRLGWYVARPLDEATGNHARYAGPHGPVAVAHLAALVPAA